ncbi:MAG: amidoligase family protein [Woeseiaceae bacterium]|nr:amidoligase family protein [Woeseiaceae bacterium]
MTTTHDDQDWQVPMPPRPCGADGAMRRIGVELEMIGLSVAAISEIVAARVGGQLDKQTRYEHRISGDEAGDWGVELDYEYLKELGRQDKPDDELRELIEEAAERVLRTGAETVVPVEVVSPPLPLARLADIQSLIADLRDAGARGSGAGWSYAFGMQFNPELPDLDGETVLRYLKAFFCLYDWLVERANVDLTRRITGFSAAFPGDYVRKVIDPDYQPELPALIDDYLAANPTRNRALDMLPLFLHLDRERVRAVVDDPRVKARPTLHYRLPNCEIDRPDWGIHLAWADWLQVEHLAGDHGRLDSACIAYAEWLDKPVSRLLQNWAEEIEPWLVTATGR